MNGQRTVRRIGGVVGVVVAALLLPLLPARAEPYLAVREGVKCSGCHSNLSGGGKRTDIVATHAKDLLHYPSFLGKFSNPPEYFTGEINQYVGLGANLRVSNTAVFEDLGANGRVDNNKVFRGRLEENRLDVTQAVMYAELRLIPDKLLLYVDQRLQPQTDNREAFALLKGVFPWKGFVKAGRMFLPYGLQLQDDGAFIRGGTNGSVNTGFSFNQQQAGVEIGVEPGPLSAMLAITDGPPGDRDVQVTGTLYTLFDELPVVRNVLAGVSFSRVGPPSTQTTLFGFYAGTNIERFSFLSEVDFREDENATTNGRSIGRFILYGEVDYLAFDWLNIKAAIDYADDDGDLASRGNDSENRISFGLEPFLNRFLQPRLFYRIGNGVKSRPDHNQNVLLAELNVFF